MIENQNWFVTLCRVLPRSQNLERTVQSWNCFRQVWICSRTCVYSEQVALTCDVLNLLLKLVQPENVLDTFHDEILTGMQFQQERVKELCTNQVPFIILFILPVNFRFYLSNPCEGSQRHKSPQVLMSETCFIAELTFVENLLSGSTRCRGGGVNCRASQWLGLWSSSVDRRRQSFHCAAVRQAPRLPWYVNNDFETWSFISGVSGLDWCNHRNGLSEQSGLKSLWLQWGTIHISVWCLNSMPNNILLIPSSSSVRGSFNNVWPDMLKGCATFWVCGVHWGECKQRFAVQQSLYFCLCSQFVSFKIVAIWLQAAFPAVLQLTKTVLKVLWAEVGKLDFNFIAQLFQIVKSSPTKFGLEFWEQKKITGGQIWAVRGVWPPHPPHLTMEGQGVIGLVQWCIVIQQDPVMCPPLVRPFHSDLVSQMHQSFNVHLWSHSSLQVLHMDDSLNVKKWENKKFFGRSCTQSLLWSWVNIPPDPLGTFLLWFWVKKPHPWLISSDYFVNDAWFILNFLEPLLRNQHPVCFLIIPQDMRDKFGTDMRHFQVLFQNFVHGAHWNSSCISQLRDWHTPVCQNMFQNDGTVLICPCRFWPSRADLVWDGVLCPCAISEGFPPPPNWLLTDPVTTKEPSQILQTYPVLFSFGEGVPNTNSLHQFGLHFDECTAFGHSDTSARAPDYTDLSDVPIASACLAKHCWKNLVSVRKLTLRTAAVPLSIPCGEENFGVCLFFRITGLECKNYRNSFIEPMFNISVEFEYFGRHEMRKKTCQSTCSDGCRTVHSWQIILAHTTSFCVIPLCSLRCTGNTAEGLELIFQGNVFDRIQHLLNSRDVIRLRMYEVNVCKRETFVQFWCLTNFHWWLQSLQHFQVVVRISCLSPEALFACRQSGLLPHLVSELNKDDVLLQVSLCFCPFCLSMSICAGQQTQQREVPVTSQATLRKGQDSSCPYQVTFSSVQYVLVVLWAEQQSRCSFNLSFQLNVLELLKDLAGCHHGIIYLEQEGVVTRLEGMMNRIDEDPLTSFLLPGKTCALHTQLPQMC